jgi:Tfp pilus assembly protein PilF
VAGEAESETLIVWDLRALRRELQGLGLDWEAPAYPRAAQSGPVARIRVEVDVGKFIQRATADRLAAEAHGLLRSGQADQALAALRRAVQTDPTHAEAHNRLAWLLLTGPTSLRDPREALPLACKASELAPENRSYRNTLGVALYRNSRWTEAIVALEKSLAQSKGKFDGFDLFFLAMCHARLGERNKARDYFDRAVRWQSRQKGLSAQHLAELKAFRAEAQEQLR